MMRLKRIKVIDMLCMHSLFVKSASVAVQAVTVISISVLADVGKPTFHCHHHTIQPDPT